MKGMSLQEDPQERHQEPRHDLVSFYQSSFNRLFEDKPPIRSMTDEDLAFHRATDLLSLPRRHMYYLQNTLLALPLISCCRRPNMRLIRLHPEG